MTSLRNYIILNKAPEERWYGWQVRCPSCLHSTPSAFTYCLMCDGYFISHGVIHFSVPESTRQNVSAQEAAEEVDVDDLGGDTEWTQR